MAQQGKVFFKLLQNLKQSKQRAFDENLSLSARVQVAETLASERIIVKDLRDDLYDGNGL